MNKNVKLKFKRMIVEAVSQAQGDATQAGAALSASTYDLKQAMADAIREFAKNSSGSSVQRNERTKRILMKFDDELEALIERTLVEVPW